MGRFPSSRNFGLGTMRVSMDGSEGHGKWMGVLMTTDGEIITWHRKGKSIGPGEKIIGVMDVGIMTMSEWLKR